MDERRARKPAAFLDRDGVLIRDHGYVYQPKDLEILPGVYQGLKLLKERGYWLILVSNQSGVARGLFTCQDVDTFHQALQAELALHHAPLLDGLYYCPHHPEGSVAAFRKACTCRKPGIGLIEQATLDFPIDWSRSLLIGDKDSDIECAINAGIKGVQVSGEQYQGHAKPFAIIDTLAGLDPCLDAINSASQS